MNEAEFQYLWSKLSFDFSSLKTSSGNNVEIVNQGEWNSGPGPDFLNACVIINGVRHFGSIELHLHPADWYHHKHHLDSFYSNVILHVVPFQALSSTFKTQTSYGEEVELLMVKTQPLESTQIERPCQTNPIHFDVALKQAEEANKAYLIESSMNILKHCDSLLGLEKSFKHASILRLFEILGYPNQANESLAFAKTWIQSLEESRIKIESNFSTYNLRNTGLGQGIFKKLEKGMLLAKFVYNLRLPVSLSEHQTYFSLLETELSKLFPAKFLKTNLTRSWLIAQCYTWSSLIYSTKAMNHFQQIWGSYRVVLPQSIQKSVITTRLKEQLGEQLDKVFPNFYLDQNKTHCKKFECLRCEIKNSKSAS